MKKKRFVYKRVVLKLSGEALQGEEPYGINAETIQSIARQIKEIHNSGLEVVIVIGGGNIFRGIQTADQEGIDRSTADYMGMLATVINGLAFQDILERMGVVTRVQGAIEMKELVEPYIRRRAIRHLEKNRVVIMVGGTGNPYFTTDTAAALRAIELNADVILKATKVDGIYSSDPTRNKKARKFDKLTYLQVLQKGLQVMDATAISLCMDNNLPIVVFNLKKEGNIKKIVQGKKIGSVVGE